jgi:hypothetical protein
MIMTLILAAAAILALIPGDATAVPHPGASAGSAVVNASFHHAKRQKLLWNQNKSPNGDVVNSQNYTSGLYTSYNDQGADDFVVPKGKSWTVTEVDVTGQYQGRGPAASEDVIFYEDDNGVPGNPVANGTFDNLGGTDNGGSFTIGLGNGLRLKAGTYWVSVVANEDLLVFGSWGWAETGTVKGHDAMWQNPGGGYGVCPTWGTLADCVSGSPAADFMFALRGRTK